MSHFKFEKFNILAHDRGARVAHRLALDHPGKVEKVVLLDIAPTLWMYEQTDMAFVRSSLGFYLYFSQSRYHTTLLVILSYDLKDEIDVTSFRHLPIAHHPHHLSLTRPRQLITRQQATGTGSS